MPRRSQRRKVSSTPTPPSKNVLAAQSNPPERAGTVRLGIPDAANEDAGMCITHIPFDVKSRLVKAINAVIRRLCSVHRGFTHRHEEQLFPCGYALRDVGTFDNGVPEDLRTLVSRIDEAIMAGYANGYEEGASLLRGLAAGTTTIQAFNEATITEKDE